MMPKYWTDCLFGACILMTIAIGAGTWRIIQLKQQLDACNAIVEETAKSKPNQNFGLIVRIPMFAEVGSMADVEYDFGKCSKDSEAGVCKVYTYDMSKAGQQVWRDEGKQTLVIDNYILGGPPFDRYTVKEKANERTRIEGGPTETE